MSAEGDAARAAIRSAIKALRRRRRLEEGAHAPAILSLSRPLVAQGLEWKEKAESLEQELQQCYKTQSRLSEQLVVEVAECRSSKAAVQEKEASICHLKIEILQASEERIQLKETVDEKVKALELLISENQSLKLQLQETILNFGKVKEENKEFINRLMLESMKNAEAFNEANALHEEMRRQLKIRSIEELARQQVDGIVRQNEAGYDFSVESTIPRTAKYTLSAHKADGCSSILFQHHSDRLLSGGHDHLVKAWDCKTGTQCLTLHGGLGSILDLAVTPDNQSIIAASSSNNLYVWDAGTCRMRHTLTGHTGKVCTVDTCKTSSRHCASGAYDHAMKIWDLQKGYCTHTILSASNCNSLCYSSDGLSLLSGHLDGNLRLWDIQTGKQMREVAAHSQAITSVCVSRAGNFVLTSGKDNVHYLFDAGTLEVCAVFRGNRKSIAYSWSRSCISADGDYIAAGSVDGSVDVWSRLKPDMISSTLAGGHSTHVISCAWSGLGTPLASADKIGNLCIWT